MYEQPRPGAPDRLLRAREVAGRCGFSRATLYRLVERNRFPPSVRITKSAVRWRESEVERWIEGLPPSAAGERPAPPVPHSPRGRTRRRLS